MKNFLIALLVFLCPVVASAQRYTNQQQGFAITLPGVADTSDSSGDTFAVYGINADHTVSGLVMVNSTVKIAGETAADFDSLLGSFGFNRTGCVYTNSSERCLFTTTNAKGIALHGVIMAIVGSNRSLYLVAAYSVDSAGLDAVPGQIVDSFQLL